MFRKLRQIEQEGGMLLGVDLALVHDTPGFCKALSLRFENMPLTFRINIGSRSFFGASLKPLQCRKKEVIRSVAEDSAWRGCFGRKLRYAELLIGHCQGEPVRSGIQFDFRDEVTFDGPIVQLDVALARWSIRVVGEARYV